MLAGVELRPEVADRFAADIVWFGEDPLLPGRSYLLRTENRPDASDGECDQASHGRQHFHTGRNSPARSQRDWPLPLQTVDPIAFDPYGENRATGAFVLIDRLTNATVGAGMIDAALRQATNVHLQAFDLNKQARAAQKFQKPAVLWFTGLSASGKSTIANRLEQRLHALGKHTLSARRR